jgi:hypothetical protein
MAARRVMQMAIMSMLAELAHPGHLVPEDSGNARC